MSKEIADALDQALVLMNDKGAHWHQGDYMNYFEDEYGNEVPAFCSVGAIREVTAGSFYQVNALTSLVTDTLASILPSQGILDSEDKIVQWNDEPDRTWADIVAKFTEAKEFALKGDAPRPQGNENP